MIETLDAVTLARVQFAFTIMFHIIFPAFSIGLASYLLVLETLWLRSGKPVYLNLFRFWRLSPVARANEPGSPQDVLHGHVDGRDSSPRCKWWPATSTGSTRWSISPSR